MIVVILAGGFGKRLQKVVNDRPKPMAEINGKPFLEIILDFLQKQEIKRVIICVGYKKEIIMNYFDSSYKTIKIDYSIEEIPLGTGGALINANSLINDENFVLINGDTYFEINLKEFFNFHLEKKSDITIALKKVKFSNRYGSVVVDNDLRVIDFKEKITRKNTLINAGYYVIKKESIKNIKKRKFSWEEFLSCNYKKLKIYGFISDSFFIDIGIPEDYYKANDYFKNTF